MPDPYFIEEPAAISFSGGRTSAYMLHRVLEAHGGLPDHIKVVFANTGMEHTATLDFVADCQHMWGIPIHWLELGEYEEVGVWKSGAHKGKIRYRASTIEVDYKTASRKGEPFERLIRKRNYLPNVVSRFCTAELKVRRIRDFLKGHHDDVWLQAIGIRADEPRRAHKIHGKIDEGHEMYCPLFIDGITKQDVHAFWKAQPFNLELPSNDGTTDLGNCTLCFLKSGKKKMSIIRENPGLADPWIHFESIVKTEGSAARFRNDQPSYQEMKTIATDQPMFDFDDDESNLACFCGE